MVTLLNETEGVSCATPGGAFYAFADFRSLLNRHSNKQNLDNDLVWAEYLLDDAHVACVPGTPFGAPGFLRLSFATSTEAITSGIDAIRHAIAKTET